MSLTIEENKQYPHSKDALFAAAKGAILGLEGKINEEDSENGALIAQIPKTIHGKVLGDRTWIKVVVQTTGDQETSLDLTAYPLNAIGQKLQFGARKGVLRTVVNWFYAHLDNKLSQ